MREPHKPNNNTNDISDEMAMCDFTIILKFFNASSFKTIVY